MKCPHCGEEIEINPASLMGSKKKTMTEEAKIQRKNAVTSRWKKKKEADNAEDNNHTEIILQKP